ncbi:MAG: 7TM-DISM domain-containing protein [Fulvivirga sp.]|uniref:7TM-DISM domain-containing protein n=1 Tax=Fulvivirga sp. TaxID=1931237 RepID=UPI0032EE2781
MNFTITIFRIKYLLSVFLIITSACGTFATNKSAPLALRGQLDLADWNLEQDGIFNLYGTWEFYWQQLLASPPVNIVPELVRAPDLWINHDANKSSIGFGTYRLQVVGELTNKEVGIYLPSMYTSHRVFVNGTEVGHIGQVGTDRNTYEPFWQATIAKFTPTSDTIDLMIQVANFHHSKGGISEQIMMGTATDIEALLAKNKLADKVKTIGLLVLALIMLVLFVIKRKIHILWFAIFSLCWSIRGAFSSTYPIFDWYPEFNWFAAIRVEYVILPLTLLVGILIFHRLYYKYTFNWAKKVAIIICLLYAGITLLSPVFWFTSLLIYFFVFLGITLFYVLIAIINTVIHSEKGSTTMSISIVLIVCLFFYDLISYQQLVSPNPYILNLGYLIIFYLLSGSMTYYALSIKKA